MNDAQAGMPRVPPCRSFLRVPGGCEGGFLAAQRSEADAVVFDLNGPEGPGDEQGLLRSRVVDAVGDLDWTGKTLAVRIHAFGSAGFYADIAALLNRGGKRIDVLIVSGIEAVPQIHTTAQILRSLVRAERMPVVELQLDTLTGFINVGLLAAPATEAGRSLHCLNPPYPVPRTGPAVDPRRRRGEQCWREAWLCAVPEAVSGSSPYEIRLIDGAPDDALDEAGFAAWTAGLAELGFHGKWTGDPARVPLCNRIFTPTPEAVDEARAVLAACDAADNDTLSAVILDGRVLDMATIRRARGVIALEAAILARRPA